MVALPSFMESCPYPLIEAMAFDKPVVAPAIPGTVDMVEDGVSALLVPPGDPTALAEAIDRRVGAEATCRRPARTAGGVAQERLSCAHPCSATLREFGVRMAA